MRVENEEKEWKGLGGNDGEDKISGFVLGRSRFLRANDDLLARAGRYGRSSEQRNPEAEGSPVTEAAMALSN